MKRLLPVTTALLVMATLAPVTVSAQSYANTVWQQLEGIYEIAEGEGYSTRNYIVGKLNDDATDTWTLRLYGGNNYTVIGACDGDCKDIDLRILTEDGAEVDSDTSEDDLPAVDVTPDRDGYYQIEVRMYECSAEPCYFGIGIFYKDV